MAAWRYKIPLQVLKRNTVEPPVNRHPWDQKKCPLEGGVYYYGMLKM